MFSNRNYDLDIFKLSDHKIVSSELLSRIKDDSNPPHYVVNERVFHFDGELVNAIRDAVIDHAGRPVANLSIAGYWQSSKYFLDIDNLIREDFRKPFRRYGLIVTDRHWN